MLDTGLARPSSPTYTAITPVTRAPERNAPASGTNLPVEETVRPSTDTTDGQRTANNGNQRSLHETIAPQLDRRNVADPESKSFVYVATNTDTGEVVRQVPSETLRRLRAYAKSIEQQETPATTQSFQKTV